mgnify:CR=1 FL=1
MVYLSIRIIVLQRNLNKLKPLSVATKEGFFGLELGHSNHEIEKNEAVRIQIRLAIQNHFTKQLNIIRQVGKSRL